MWRWRGEEGAWEEGWRDDGGEAEEEKEQEMRTKGRKEECVSERVN